MSTKTKTNGTAIAEMSQLTIPAIEIGTARILVVGEDVLIAHGWSDKARRQMAEKQAKKASQTKEARNPQEDFEQAQYRLEDGSHGFPAAAFKQAAIRGAKYAGLVMADAKGAFHVQHDGFGSDRTMLVRLICDEPIMRTDMVRIAMGTADIRYRPEYSNWSAIVTVRFNRRLYSTEQIVNMFNFGGFHAGIGEWRPELGGSMGMFHVAEVVYDGK